LEAVLRQHGTYDSRDVTSERITALENIVTAIVPSAADEFEDVRRTILPEFDAYGELIAAVDANVAGLLVRGEGENFTARVSGLMGRWGMTDEAIEFHVTLADAFDHTRIFLKLEWWEDHGRLERQIAVYYRRRPYVHHALKILADFAGPTCLPLGEFRELAALLGKETVHFVAFTARPDRPLWYKFYFSQYLTPESYTAAQMRLERSVARFAPESAAAPQWAAYHDRLAPRWRQQSIFVSIAMSEDGSDGSLKIDYPDVEPTVAAALLQRAAVLTAEERLRCLCGAAGRKALSYLGVRIGRPEHLILKGYADFI
jgi:hypothetical protein